MLAQQHLQHNPIYLIVGTIVGHRAHHLARLSIAVRAPLPLLVPGGVPAQIIVHHGVKMVLQVDPFTQAIGRHQHPLWMQPQLLHPRLSLGRRQGPGHGRHRYLAREFLAQLFCHIIGGGDKAAK